MTSVFKNSILFFRPLKVSVASCSFLFSLCPFLYFAYLLMILCDLLSVQACVGVCQRAWACAGVGVPGCAQVCMGVCGRAWVFVWVCMGVSSGVCRYAGACAGMWWYASWVCVGMRGCAQVCADVCGFAQMCLGVHRYAIIMNFQNSSWRLMFK